MRRILLLAVVGLAACFRPQIGEVECGDFGRCPPGATCDVDGVCRAPDDLRGDGDVGADAGRLTEPPAFAVAHLAAPVTDFGDISMVVTGAVVIDTDELAVGAPFNIAMSAAEQIDGPDVALLVVSHFEVRAGATVRVRGSRALVIVAGDAFVDGLIDASAEGSTSGPGAGSEGRGNDGASVQESHAGGGGGAFAVLGGRGGDTEDAAGGAGGEVVGDAAQSRLAGGSPGGSAALGADCERRGGGGGGAVQLASPGEIHIGATGVIASNGGGGDAGGPCPGGRGGPGGGGGSGGAIYLEAETVTIAGSLVANGGGGGGGGGDDPGQDGEPGGDGSSVPGLGGGGGDDSGDGGDAGDDIVAPADGDEARTSNGGGGGGGGACGRIAVDGLLDATSDAVITPRADIQ